jgi:riboflavin synthase
MFTGIVERVGHIESLEIGAQGSRLRVHAGPLAASLHVSDSIAVNGCCLTVVELSGELFAADLSSETIRRTAFAEMKRRRPRKSGASLDGGQELGGHFMQGHASTESAASDWRRTAPTWVWSSPAPRTRPPWP